MYVTLRKGDRLPSVALAQARLVEAGATDLAVDGIFGNLTQAAVSKFQLEVGYLTLEKSIPRRGRRCVFSCRLAWST